MIHIFTFKMFTSSFPLVFAIKKNDVIHTCKQKNTYINGYMY